MHKLLGTWEGFSLNMHARTRFGYDINADAGAFALQNAGMLDAKLPGDYHGHRHHRIDVRAGFLPLFRG